MDDPLAILLVDMVRRRGRIIGELTDFMIAHASQGIADLSDEESRKLFAILLANSRLEGELRTLDKVVARLLNARDLQ
jgi:hypothetical protein